MKKCWWCKQDPSIAEKKERELLDKLREEIFDLMMREENFLVQLRSLQETLRAIESKKDKEIERWRSSFIELQKKQWESDEVTDRDPDKA